MSNQSVFVILRSTIGAVSAIARAVEGLAAVERVEAAPPEKRRRQGYANGKRDKGISGEDLMMQLLTEASAPVRNHDIKEMFELHGFAPSSASPVLAELKTRGVIESPAKGLWQLKKTEAA